jgi:small subunit ribosomal protein S6
VGGGQGALLSSPAASLLAMTPPAPVYDLVLLLDTSAEESLRAKVLADVQQAISVGGEQLRHDDWGVRALAYPIDHRTDAEYHLLQFHATAELLERLHRTLRITDGIVRFRIVKLKPGTPDAPEMGAPRREAEPAAVGEPAA